MNFIAGPLIVFIVTAGVYAIFELLIRRKERLAIIEKLAEKLSADQLGVNCNLPLLNLSSIIPDGKKYGALKIAGLLVGLGLGLLVGFAICYKYIGLSNNGDWMLNRYRDTVLGASMMLCGGLGLFAAFVMELNLRKKK